jgi:hypothetical protein
MEMRKMLPLGQAVTVRWGSGIRRSALGPVWQVRKATSRRSLDITGSRSIYLDNR